MTVIKRLVNILGQGNFNSVCVPNKRNRVSVNKDSFHVWKNNESGNGKQKTKKERNSRSSPLASGSGLAVRCSVMQSVAVVMQCVGMRAIPQDIVIVVPFNYLQIYIIFMCSLLYMHAAVLQCHSGYCATVCHDASICET